MAGKKYQRGRPVKEKPAVDERQLSCQKETHDELFKEGCPVCEHPKKLAAEKFYLSGSFRPVEIDRLLSLADGTFLKHAKASGLPAKLAANSDALYGIITEKLHDRLENGEFSDADLLKAGLTVAKQHDLIQGRIKPGGGDPQPPQILIANFPAPGGFLPAGPSGMALERPTIDAEAVWVPAGGTVAPEAARRSTGKSEREDDGQ